MIDKFIDLINSKIGCGYVFGSQGETMTQERLNVLIEQQGIAHYHLLYRKYNLSELDKNEVEKDFRVETDTVGKTRFYTEESETVADEELSQYVLLKLLDKLDNLDIKINIMKKIMILWCVLTIIGVIFSLYLVSK